MIEVCCALIEEETQNGIHVWVAQKQPSSYLSKLWEFPGGKIEQGESRQSAIIREIKEELGIAITVVDTIPPSIYNYDTHCIQLHPFICRLQNPYDLPRPIEHLALALLSHKSLKDIALAPADIPVLQAYLDKDSRHNFKTPISAS